MGHISKLLTQIFLTNKIRNVLALCENTPLPSLRNTDGGCNFFKGVPDKFVHFQKDRKNYFFLHAKNMSTMLVYALRRAKETFKM